MVSGSGESSVRRATRTSHGPGRGNWIRVSRRVLRTGLAADREHAIADVAAAVVLHVDLVLDDGAVDVVLGILGLQRRRRHGDAHPVDVEVGDLLADRVALLDRLVGAGAGGPFLQLESGHHRVVGPAENLLHNGVGVVVGAVRILQRDAVEIDALEPADDAPVRPFPEHVDDLGDLPRAQRNPGNSTPPLPEPVSLPIISPEPRKGSIAWLPRRGSGRW